MWYDNWQERKEGLETFGLPVILAVELTSKGFLSLLVQIDEAYLLRSHRELTTKIRLRPYKLPGDSITAGQDNGCCSILSGSALAELRSYTDTT